MNDLKYGNRVRSKLNLLYFIFFFGNEDGVGVQPKLYYKFACSYSVVII